MKYNIIFKDGALCLPASAFLLCEDVMELKLLMLLSYDRTLCDADDTVLAEQLGCTLNEFESTVASLKEKGLLESKKLSPSVSSKNLSGTEIEKAINENASLKELISGCEEICSRVFTPTDISKLVSLNTVLGVDCQYIYLLFSYQAKKLEAVDKKISVSYVEKSAYSLFNQGIKTVNDLKKYIDDTEKKNTVKYKLSHLFGTGERAFTKKEKQFFDKWLVEWAMPYELVEAAFEITVNNTGKPGLEYMSKILSDWHDSGITTVEQAEKANADYKATLKNKAKFSEKFKEKADTQNGVSFNTEEFFDKALKRSMAIMGASQNEEKKKEEGGK